MSGFRVDALNVEEAAKVSCTGCGWAGKAGSLAEIGGCSLTAGDLVPAGRCPKCAGLCGVVSAEAAVDQEALEASAELVEADEALRKGRPVDQARYAALLSRVKRLVKKALRMKPVVGREPQP